MSFEGQITDKIYHGCTTRYANGEKKLIDFEKCKRCLLPTSEPNTKACCIQKRNSTKNRILIIGLFKTIYI